MQGPGVSDIECRGQSYVKYSTEVPQFGRGLPSTNYHVASVEHRVLLLLSNCGQVVTPHREISTGSYIDLLGHCFLQVQLGFILC